ncbi:hypothetical protein O181_037004 [Austropuccinia psidii MF-1]|uniref:G protein-coupled receptor GPR1/2/3 C-terminal domain-containing protein n=1 Tax=Austropuccinia psidii MF-1 TaxID=1389203 RepID=A0A9Q3HC35_9BASI|nr:hypothetical protein [Austropuccinia psidii MF-1]
MLQELIWPQPQHGQWASGQILLSQSEIVTTFDEVTSSLQSTHPMTKGEHIVDYWKGFLIKEAVRLQTTLADRWRTDQRNSISDDEGVFQMRKAGTIQIQLLEGTTVLYNYRDSLCLPHGLKEPHLCLDESILGIAHPTLDFDFDFDFDFDLEFGFLKSSIFKNLLAFIFNLIIMSELDPSQPIHRVSVAIAATLSFTATSLLFIYVITLFALSNLQVNFDPSLQNLNSKRAWLKSWARHRLSFIKTPFGIMFMNLVFADFIQAFGFGMNYVWVSRTDVKCHDQNCASLCTMQGLLIQLGDVASAFSNLMIAIQTFVILTFSWHLPNWITWASLALIWVPVLVLGLAPPTIKGNWTGDQPFYTWSGDWCWINQQFQPLRLFLHYLWIFISAFASIALYGHLFLRLQIHFRRSHAPEGFGWLRGKVKPGAIATDLLDGPVLPLQGDHLRKKLERKARAMLMYPIAFIFMILPLSTYRLASLAGHDWGITVAAMCGSMYCLSGFVDVLLFGTTRSILSVPVFSLNIGKPGGAPVIGMSSSGLSGGGTRSAFRVEVVQETVIDLDEPSDLEKKRIRYVSEGGPSNNSSRSNSQNNNPLLHPIRLSSPSVHGQEFESRHPSLSIFSSELNILTHQTSTDPTPWYGPLPLKRQ